MKRSPIDRRAKRYAPLQCVADTGHKDAPCKCPAYGAADIICHLGKLWRMPVTPSASAQCEIIGECKECKKATGGRP